jgi:hypothetical protein
MPSKNSSAITPPAYKSTYCTASICGFEQSPNTDFLDPLGNLFDNFLDFLHAQSGKGAEFFDSDKLVLVLFENED